MFAPSMVSVQPAPTYPAPAYVPRRPAVQAAAPTQPKPLVRAQAPEEPNPARPPLLTLPSPEQLGVAVRPVNNTADWAAFHARMKELGVVSFHMESLPDGRARFTCWLPREQSGLTRCIESIGATEAEAVQRGLQEAAQSRGQATPQR